MQVARDAPPRAVSRFDHAPAGGVELGRASAREIALVQRLLGPPALVHVRERHRGAGPVRCLDRRHRVGDQHERAVAPDPVVLDDLGALTALARVRDRALLDRVSRPVRALVVHGRVGGLAEQLAELVVAEHVERRAVRIAQPPGVVDDPHGLDDRGQDRVALEQHLFALAPLLNVGEGDDRPRAAGHVDRDRRVGHREHRTVAAEEPVELRADRLPGRARQQHRALVRRIARPVRAVVVDQGMAVAPKKLVRVLIAERLERRRVGEADQAVVIHDPDGLGNAVEHRGQECLGADSWIDHGQGRPSLRLRSAALKTVRGAPGRAHERAPERCG